MKCYFHGSGTLMLARGPGAVAVVASCPYKSNSVRDITCTISCPLLDTREHHVTLYCGSGKQVIQLMDPGEAR